MKMAAIRSSVPSMLKSQTRSIAHYGHTVGQLDIIAIGVSSCRAT